MSDVGAPGGVPRIERARPADLDDVADVVAEAFAELPPSQWLVPAAGRRRAVLRADFRIVLEVACTHGEIHVASDGSAAAAWVHADGSTPPPLPRDYDTRLAAACGEYTERFRLLDELFETHHPPEPHHHLAMIAVRPDRQGAGRGTMLLRHHHRHLDGHGVAAYLEAASRRSRRLYTRFGYSPRSPFYLPDGPPFYPMWREPQAVAH